MSNPAGAEARFHDDFYAGEVERIDRSALIQAVHERVVRDFVSRGSLGATSRVLSLGCGEGRIERRLARHVGRVRGVDVSSVAVERARGAAEAVGIRNAEFTTHDLAAGPLPWEAGSVDAVCLFGVLHHLPDAAIPGLLRESRRLLAPGGTICSIDPSTRRLIAWLKPLVRRTYERLHSPEERELDPARTGKLFLEAGFADVRIEAADYFSIPLGFLLPGFPRLLAPALLAADALLRAAPLVRSLASSFAVYAHR